MTGVRRRVFRRLPPIDPQTGVYPTIVTTPSGAVVAWIRRSAGGSVIAHVRLGR